MSFTTKVKHTRELFIATTDLGTTKDLYRDAHPPLNESLYYAGHLFLERLVGTTHCLDFEEATSAIFHGSELEQDYGDVRPGKS